MPLPPGFESLSWNNQHHPSFDETWKPRGRKKLLPPKEVISTLEDILAECNKALLYDRDLLTPEHVSMFKARCQSLERAVAMMKKHLRVREE